MRLFVVIFLFSGQFLSAQVFTDPVYSKGYFRNPLGIPMSLSGNFGELRPNHYHMGLDLRTQQRENLPVVAAAEGYIAKIKIEPNGFGQAIYINHPNGYTTLYAHLNHFIPALEAWVKQQQYAQGSWQIMLDVPPRLFPVKKGDLIAYSGNTGGSQAPHLHFEIRTTADDVNLNPLLFGLPLPDNTPPVIQRLAFYDRTKSIYEQSPRIIAVKSVGHSAYSVAGGIVMLASPRISLAISAYDTHTGSSNRNGIYEAVLLVDGEAVSGFRMNGISYNATRYINAHIDYKTRATGGPYLQLLSALPGYVNSIYKGAESDSALDISDGKVHTVRIEVKDPYKNTAILTCKVQYNGSAVSTQPLEGKLFHPFMLDGMETNDCEFFIGERCLYDQVHIRYAATASSLPQVVSAVHTIGAPYIPLHEPFLVRIRPNDSLPDTARSHVVMQWFAGNKKDVSLVTWQNGWASAQFRDLGSYQLVVDNEPPVIVPTGFAEGADLGHASRIAFTVKDNLERIKNVQVTLDGQWLLFSNDKGQAFVYTFDEKCPPGPHELKISAEDEAGNVTVQSFRFTR